MSKQDINANEVQLENIKAKSEVIGSNAPIRQAGLYNYEDFDLIPKWLAEQLIGAGSGLLSVTAEAPNIDFVADAFGGYYLPFGLPEGQSVVKMIVTNADDTITHSYPDYDSEAQAITGFASNDAKKVKIFYTNI